MVDIEEDSNGRLWTFFHVSDRNWLEGLASRPMNGKVGQTIADERRFWDTIVEVIDERGKSIAVGRFDVAILGLLSAGHGYSYREDDGGFPRIDVWTFRLQC